MKINKDTISIPAYRNKKWIIDAEEINKCNIVETTERLYLNLNENLGKIIMGLRIYDPCHDAIQAIQDLDVSNDIAQISCDDKIATISLSKQYPRAVRQALTKVKEHHHKIKKQAETGTLPYKDFFQMIQGLERCIDFLNISNIDELKTRENNNE